MKYDDRTEIRNMKKEKRRWKAAAVVDQQDLSDWMRQACNERADVSLVADED